MKIGELANTAGVTTKTIRYYESIGVLEEPARTESGYRMYGPGSIERLDFVIDRHFTPIHLDGIRKGHRHRGDSKLDMISSRDTRSGQGLH